MAPVRKSRSVNKRFPYPNEVSPSKDGDSASKNNKRKRKVSDMLGPQWSKEELQRFYEAYRKNGKDWKKVAAVVRHRSMEMVEALYTMNRAYLSLPEGTASVVGLIAMMTDHYSVLEGSDSEQESNDGVGISRKSHKRPRGKLQPNSRGLDRHHSDVSHSQSPAPTYGCLSLLKRRRSDGNQPRAVGKRTPRIPVKYAQDSAEKYISPSRQGLKSKLDADDDDVAHEVALALAGASHRGGSPEVSQTPKKRRETVTTSPAGFGERRCSGSEMTSAKTTGNEIDDDGCEGSLGSTEGNNSCLREKPQFVGRKGVGTSIQTKARKSLGKKVELKDVSNHDVDDEKEACSGTEEAQRFSSFESKPAAESRDLAFVRPPGQASKKRSKKVLFVGDEGVALDALQALADLSLMMPSSIAEAESSMLFREERECDIPHSRPQETGSARTKQRASPSKKRGDQLARNTLVSESKTLKFGEISVRDSNFVAEMKDPGIRRKNHKSTVKKSLAQDVRVEADASTKQKEVLDQLLKPVTKSRRSSQNTSDQFLGQLVRISEHSSTSTDIKQEGDDSVASPIQAPANINITLPTRFRSRRKLNKSDIHRNSRDLKSLEELVDDKSNKSRLLNHEKIVDLKGKLWNCLSNYRVRRWCVCEWFYSAVDYPWFAKSEFVEYLYHVGLGHVPRLTRVEWGVIRSSLGKPRRFSEQFLNEEKEKLNYYRDSVRNHYTELRMGKREGLPADLARPLTVGQRVISIHPRSREVHNGSILTVDHSRCRVQFDRPDLGVEFIKDIDCMPLNPLENMPTSSKRHNIAVDKFYEALKQFNVCERPEDRMKEEFIKFTPGQKVENVENASHVTSAFLTNNMSKQAKDGSVSSNTHNHVGYSDVVRSQPAMSYQQSALSQMQSKEADIRALAELTRALDKKNALVTELKRMNDDVSENSSLKDVDSFKKQYAAVLVQLNGVLDQVSLALLCLRQRNTYQGNSSLIWQKPIAGIENRGNFFSSLNCLPPDSQETGSHVYEIVETSRLKGRNMVDAVLQVVSSIKEGANVDHEVENSADHVTHCPVDKSTIPLQTTHLNGSFPCKNQLNSCTSNDMASNQASGACSNRASSDGEAQVPSELITNCVATLLMVQKCTERQFPPAEVAQILDFAVTSLQPECSQNLPVYSEIQKCMGIIRNQILALIPT